MLVQTVAPEARAIVRAAAHDSDGFLAGELERRRALAYPPFSHLIRIVCSVRGTSSMRAGGGAGAARRARGRPPTGATAASRRSVLGPATLFRLRGRERQMLVVKAAGGAPAVAAVGAGVQALADSRAHPQVSFSVDVDPQ